MKELFTLQELAAIQGLVNSRIFYNTNYKKRPSAQVLFDIKAKLAEIVEVQRYVEEQKKAWAARDKQSA